MNRSNALLLAAGLLATSTALCATSGPQSYLDGVPQNKNNPRVQAVRILSVDGVAPQVMPYALFPGPHWITAVPQSATTGRATPPETFVLKVAPCTYYYIAARNDAAFGGAWKLIVDGEDTMVQCNPAEELRKAQAAAAPAPVASPAKPAAPPAKPASH